MNRPAFIFILVVISTFAAEAETHRVPPTTLRYEITARLFPEQRLVKATEIVRFTNTSTVPLTSIPFHLYPNAFRSSRTTYMRQYPGEFKIENSGAIDIESIRIDSLMVRPDRFHFESPDDKNPDDFTVARLPLQAALLPGETVAIRFSFQTRIPRGMGRSDVVPDCQYFFVSQWYPKPGVLHSDGSWSCAQYHYPAEFFAEFADFAVSITVPENYDVGASGSREQKSTNNNQTTTFVFREQGIHDFAWMASSSAIRSEKMFIENLQIPVRVNLFLRPEHEDQRGRYFTAIGRALIYFASHYGPYPYRNLTIIDPPRTSSSNGMEYPTLIVCGTSEMTLQHVQAPEYILFHEFAHQYWYGVVATDETDDAWMDEGVASYTAARALLDTYGPNLASFRVGGIPFYGYPLVLYQNFPIIAYLGRVEIPYPTWRLKLYLENAQTDPMSRDSWRDLNYSSYRVNAYNKPELMFFSLERILGRDRFQQGLRRYFWEYRFRHPNRIDFVSALERSTDSSLDWFFDPLLTTTGVLDYGVKSVSNHVEQNGTITSTVLLWRYGTLSMPEAVRVWFSDGSHRDTVWNDNGRYNVMTFHSTAMIVSAAIDPDSRYLFDINSMNNSYTVESHPWGAILWTARWFFWMQNILHLVSSIS